MAIFWEYIKGKTSTKTGKVTKIIFKDGTTATNGYPEIQVQDISLGNMITTEGDTQTINKKITVSSLDAIGSITAKNQLSVTGLLTANGGITSSGLITANGGIITKGNQHGKDQYGIDLNNSDIIGVNCIKTKDSAETSAEGIRFFRTEDRTDDLVAKEGILYFNPNQAFTPSAKDESAPAKSTLGYQIYHTGNLPIIDNLDSVDSKSVLSAKQGNEIKKRLDNLGFNEGSCTMTTETTSQNYMYKQGNVIYGFKLVGMDKKATGHYNYDIGTVPSWAIPNKTVTFTSEDKYGGTITINTEGKIHLDATKGDEAPHFTVYSYTINNRYYLLK